MRLLPCRRRQPLLRLLLPGLLLLSLALPRGSLAEETVFVRPAGSYSQASSPLISRTDFHLGVAALLLAALIPVLLRNIHARRKAESDLREALTEAERTRDKITAILRSIADGLIVTDLERRIILINRAAEQLLQMATEEVLFQPADGILRHPAFRQQLKAALTGGPASAPADVELTDAESGADRVLQSRVAVVRNRDGAATGLVAILQDVTRARTLERMKSEFIATAAHELRTPLTTILGYAELMRREEEFGPEQRQEFLGLILARAETLGRIIDDLLDLSRVESGLPLALDRTPCRMADLVGRAVDQYRRISPRHRFEIDLPEAEPELLADRGKIEQVLENLLSNAVKYSPRGGAIRLSGSVAEGSFRLTVEDQGIGMTPDQVGKVFEKFYRADPSDTAVGGLGLGMAIVRSIVEAHGGAVEVESRKGIGTRVTFALPLPRESSLPISFQAVHG